MIHHVLPIFLLSLGLVVPALGQTVIFENVNVIPMDRQRVVERQTVIVRPSYIA